MSDSSDAISVVALVVSLVALIVTLLQAAQQYAATAYSYRHCSERAVGGWHRHRHRRFIWNELRFEVTFKAPIISLWPLPSAYTLPKPDKGVSMISSTDISQSSKLNEARYHFHSPHNGTVTIYTPSSDNPWFLSLKGTRSEARCTWLSLLNDVSYAHLQFDLNVNQLSYDFMPQGITRPMAQMDRKSFLTLMTLFRVQWSENSLTGAGEICEVTSRDLLNFGAVYSYHALGVRQQQIYYLVSEKARSAMFNRFDLGFHVHLTHNADELFNSLLGIVDKDVAEMVKGYNEMNAGWSPGVGETICCFGEPEMPKCVDHEADSFLSIYSAVPANSSLADPPVIRLLAGNSVPHSSADVRELHKWISSYLSPSHSNTLQEFISPAEISSTFKSMCQLYDSNFGGTPIPWTLAKKCLPIIHELDKHLLTLAHKLSPNEESQVQLEFARMQIRHGCHIFNDASERAKEEDGFWLDIVPATQAGYYVQIAGELFERFPGGDIAISRDIVVNRLLRGALWNIHNGNRPTQQERTRECSLNSRWLSNVSTIWVD